MTYEVVNLNIIPATQSTGTNWGNLKLNPKMKKLGVRLYNLISSGVKTMGSYNPDRILFFFEENLYTTEVDTVILFLQWVDKDVQNRAFGHSNYEQKFKEFLFDQK